MHYLIYVSAAVKLFTNADLDDLLLICQHNNFLNDITGMLLYSEGTFIQVLEGEAQTLAATFAKIQHDARHTGVIKLAEGVTDSRVFPKWSMGFKVVNARDFARFDAFIHPLDVKASVQDNQHTPIQIIKAFIETNF